MFSDGANLYVWEKGYGFVKVQESDGAILGTPSLGLQGLGATAVCFDGANFWVLSGQSGVAKVPASGGTVTKIQLPFVASGITYDGTHIWVVNQNGREVADINLSNGAVSNSILVGDGPGPSQILSDGVNLWITNSQGPKGGNLLKVPLSNPNPNSGKGYLIGGTNPGTTLVVSGIAFDGSHVWVTATDGTGGGVYEGLGVNDVGGPPPVAPNPTAVTFDGTNIWVANSGNNTVTKVRASDGTVLATYPVGAAPVALFFDGASIWVANHDDNTLTRIPVH